MLSRLLAVCVALAAVSSTASAVNCLWYPGQWTPWTVSCGRDTATRTLSCLGAPECQSTPSLCASAPLPPTERQRNLPCPTTTTTTTTTAAPVTTTTTTTAAPVTTTTTITETRPPVTTTERTRPTCAPFREPNCRPDAEPYVWTDSNGCRMGACVARSSTTTARTTSRSTPSTTTQRSTATQRGSTSTAAAGGCPPMYAVECGEYRSRVWDRDQRGCWYSRCV